jgi:hypothetical protein
VAGRDNAGIGDQQHCVGAELARQAAGLPRAADSEHQARTRLMIEWPQ